MGFSVLGSLITVPLHSTLAVNNLGNFSKQLYSNRTHILGRRGVGVGGSQRHHLSSNITKNILLVFKFELTQEYSASKSRH